VLKEEEEEVGELLEEMFLQRTPSNRPSISSSYTNSNSNSNLAAQVDYPHRDDNDSRELVLVRTLANVAHFCAGA